MSQDIIIKLKTDDKDLESTIKDLEKLGLIDKKNADEFVKNQKKYSQGYKKQGQDINKLDKMITNVGTTIAGVFAVQKLIGFGEEIIQITGEFQRLEAVLKNTLGSDSEAQKSLNMIVQFAKETPFDVAGLTDSFVKLANQGFKPTRDEMRKLGDLASSTGKGFDQLAEAIIDAQTGEFERLKEFGVRAKKQGDQVTFTFKGVETQVANTEAAMRDYLLTLGDVNGVSGAMAAISETIEGKISNLGDSYDQMILSLDEGTGIVTSAVGGATDALSEMMEQIRLINTSDMSGFEQIAALFSVFNDPVLAGMQQSQLDMIEKIDNGIMNMTATQIQNGATQFKLIAAYQELGLTREESIQRIHRKIAILDEEGRAAVENAAKQLEVEAKNESLRDAIEEKEAKKRNEIAAKKRASYEKELADYEAYLKRASDMAEKGAEADGEMFEEFTKKEIESERLLRDLQIEVNLEGEEQEKARLIAKHEDNIAKLETDSIEYNQMKVLYDEQLEQDLDAIELRKQTKEEANAKESVDRARRLQQAKAQIYQDDLRALSGLFGAASQLFAKGSESEKAFTLFGIGLDTAAAISSLTAASQANPGNAFTFGGAGAAQFISGLTQILSNVATAKSYLTAPPPAQNFKDGVIRLQGAGTETSDSIAANLSVNESVIKAKQSRKYEHLLRAINDDNLDSYIAQNWNFAPNLPKVKTGSDDAWIDSLTQNLGMNGFSGDEIVGALRNNDKNENKRLNLLINAIQSNNNYKSHRK